MNGLSMAVGQKPKLPTEKEDKRRKGRGDSRGWRQKREEKKVKPRRSIGAAY